MKTCRTCYASFMPKYGFEKDCLRCYIRRKREEERNYYQQQWRQPPPPQINLPPENEWREMLPRLIRLAHPDRHGNSEVSNVVTQWLLRQRDRLRAA